MTTTNTARRPSAPTPSPRPSAPMPPSPKQPANAPKTTTRCTVSPACWQIWPASAPTTSNPPTRCQRSPNSPPPPRCNGEPTNSSTSLTASVTCRQYTPQPDHKTPGHTPTRHQARGNYGLDPSSTGVMAPSDIGTVGMPTGSGGSSADVGGVGSPVSGRGLLPNHGGFDVDAEHSSEDRGGKFGGEGEQCGGPGLAGSDVESVESFAEPFGADVLARPLTGKQPRTLAGLSDHGVGPPCGDQFEDEICQRLGQRRR